MRFRLARNGGVDVPVLYRRYQNALRLVVVSDLLNCSSIRQNHLGVFVLPHECLCWSLLLVGFYFA